jgi:hypothetical protein
MARFGSQKRQRGMVYLIAAYVVFVGFTVMYVLALIARRKRVQADLDELRSSHGANGARRS